MTFTKKAAGEMQHRLETLLKEDEEYQIKLESANGVDKNMSGDGAHDEIFEEVVHSNGSGTSRAPSSSALITRVTLGTFHSICAKILRWNGSELSDIPSIQHYKKGIEGDLLDGSFAIIDQSEQMRVIKQCLTDAGIDLKGSGRGKPDIRPITILNAVGQLKSDDAMGVDGRASSDDFEDRGGGVKMTSKVRRIAEDVYPLYRKALLSQNSLDFDDLILLTRELLKTNDDVRERMANRWQHILVDEFQDTSEAQLDLVRLLSRDSLLIVGDGDQSIYSWRGAYAESMSDFVDKFEKAKDKKVDTVYLMENYRSTTNIVKAAQKVISDESSPDVNTGLRQDMKPMRGRGPSPRVLACYDAKAEATFVVKEINKMVREGVLNPSSTVALIYRTNAQSRALEEACVEHNLKYLVRGSAGTFYSRAEIKDCLCFLKWLYNGRDRTAMVRAMKTPSRGLGDVSLKEFSNYCDDVVRYFAEKDPNGPQPSPLDILLSLTKIGQGDERLYLPPDGVISKRTLTKLLLFANQMNKVSRKAQSQTVIELLGSIIDIMNLKTHFDAISKTSDEFADRWANVMELLNASERYTQDGACMEKKQTEIDGEIQIEELSPLGNFLDDVSLLTETEGAEDESDNEERRLLANLMTIHASKGMEFDAVFLVGNEESTFPTQRAIMEGEGSIELNEERRLCYVAMTRAKTHLIMTWRKEVTTFFGQGFKVNKAERSRFLDALMSKKKGKNPATTKRANSPEDTALFKTTGKPRMKKVKKLARPKRATRAASDPLALPLPKKKLLKRKKSTSQRSASGYAARQMAMNTLKKNAEVREEKQKWADFYAKKNRPTAASSRSASPKRVGQTFTAAGATERGRRALSNKATIKPRGNRTPLKKGKMAVKSSRSSRRESSLAMNDIQKSERSMQRDTDAPPMTDSSMFFPIGSNVKHVIHGEGKVVKPADGQNSQNVHVDFQSGMKIDFPVTGGGLVLKYD